MSQQSSDVRDGMRIDWDVPIEMDDGLSLRCDVYRPIEDGEYPVILTMGPYGKWYHMVDRVGDRWTDMVEDYPEVAAGTSGKYANWEVVDPEKWVPDDYAVVRVDSRGAGRSPGYLDVWSDREARDLVECIEWAGVQSWSNGKVGLSGISYYAMNQWQAAAYQPEHLAAICPWEGAADFYRDVAYHGGIHCTFGPWWYPGSVEAVQHGKGYNGPKSRYTGGLVSGPETLPDEILGANRADLEEDWLSNELATDEFWTSRMPDWSKVEVPILSAANWGHSMHLRGNVEGYLRAASDQKWLEIHGREHWTEFYTDYGLDLQKRFFGHFLKGEDTGWEDQPRVQVQARRGNLQFVERHAEDWPLPETDWTRYYLHPDGMELSTEEPDSATSITYDPFGDGLTFMTDPLEETTEATGPIAAKLFVSSETEDADLFLVVRAFDPDMSEIVFQGAIDPHRPVALGWLRASHRKLDPDLSTEWRPYHTHDEVQPLDPGEVYELDVEIWPGSIVAEPGSRLALSVRGRDYVHPGTEGERFQGIGAFKHNQSRDRPPEVYGGDVTLHAGPDHPSHVLMPIVPTEK